MSETTYKFGDPVWVQVNGKTRPGFYVRLSRAEQGCHAIAYQLDDGADYNIFKSYDIDPRPIPPAPTGWRLPEPGDVVRVKVGLRCDSFEAEVACVDDRNPFRLGLKGWYNEKPAFALSEVQCARLRDAPEPPVAEAAAPEEPGEQQGLDALEWSNSLRLAYDLLDKADAPMGQKHAELLRDAAKLLMEDVAIALTEID